MKNTKVYLFAKKIHRLLVIIILTTGIVMAVTGLFMYSGNYLSWDPLMVRILHHQLSIIFTLVLGLMGLTGSYLFIFPYLR
jgi:cytochrome b subunit of formate dehydrogenase